jgi:hypothetical protein
MTPFDFAAERLGDGTVLSRLAARGMLRYALGGAGLDHTASAEELAVVVRKLLPVELAKRRVASDAGLCEQLAQAISQQAFDAPVRTETAVDVFRRLAGD